MPGGTSKGSSNQQANLTPGETALYNQTGQNVQDLQNLAPVSDFLKPNPTAVAPLSNTQQQSVDLMNQNLSQATSGQAQQQILNPNARYSNLLSGTDQPISSDPTLQQTQRYAGLMGSTGGAYENSPIVQAGTRYFQSAIAPGIENQATLSGLGRSTANTSALSAAQAQTMLPLLQGEEARQQGLITGEQSRQDQLMQQAQARRDALITGEQGRTDTLATQQQARVDQLVTQGMTVGDAQRQVAQEANNAQAVDAQRRQAISESALFGPLGQLPSTFGQNVQQSGKQTGMFGTFLCSFAYFHGKMDADTYLADCEFGDGLSAQVKDGYARIALPLVRAMYRSRFLSALLIPFILMWGKEMRRRVDGIGRGSWVGRVILKIGVPICRFLGTEKGSILCLTA